MKVCFIGIGSIALRHIRNLKDMYGPSIHITALRSGNGRLLSEEERKLINCVIYGVDEMASCYDAIFVTNPTSKHYETISSVIDRSDVFFVEKPVFYTGDEDYSGFIKNGKAFYVACPLRYCKEIEYLKTSIDYETIHSIRCICSSYLPEWRPEIDYRESYSASKEQGGGVSLDLVHEWDYVTHLFGFPQSVKSIITKKSELEIDSDDVAIYIANYPRFVIEMHLDYFGRIPMRKIELFTKDETIVCDLNKHSLRFLKEKKTVQMKESRDDFQKRELRHFIRIVNGEIESDNNLSHACRVLRLARGEI